jgi:hypothetical protein
MNTDTLSVLTHSRNKVTKTWKADGTIAAFDDAKYYTLTQTTVASIESLSALLTSLSARPNSCLIRGVPVPDSVAASRDGDQHRPNLVRKALDYFDDQPLHTVMVDVDGYHPFAWDPVTNPLEATQEFIATQLPSEWQSAAYHWHLSSSFGHPSKSGTGLRVHLWFWLARPLTSAQLKAYAKASGLAADVALFNPVQAHFTANPYMDDGVTDTVAARSGYAAGDSAVQLSVSDAILTAVASAGGGGQTLLDIATTDAAAIRLNELGLVKSRTRDGFNIECPFDDEHSGPSAESATQYRLPHTNGHSLGQFICLHAHCTERPRLAFMEKLGLVNTLDDFDDLSDMPEVIAERAEEIIQEAVKGERFRVFDAIDFIKRDKSSWFIKGILPRANFGVFYGASGSGKSFLVFDMLAGLAQGTNWCGHKTAKARVLWIAAEGQEDMRKRVFGFCQHRNIDPALFEMKFIANAPNLLKVEDVKDLIRQVKKAGVFDVIIIDTLAQVMPGGDENSGEDMGKVMGHCKEITRLTGAMVAPIHHSGKDASRGARGWSGLRAACDFEYEVIREGEDRAVTITKMKGGADGGSFGFCLDTIIVGQDDDGDDETTCVIRFTDATRSSVIAAKTPAGANQKLVMSAVDTLTADGTGVSMYALVANVMSQIPMPIPPKRDSRAQHVKQAVESLIEKRSLINDSGVITKP